MKTKVDEYKGFDIFFDSYDGTFSVEGYDSFKDKKKSFNSCKTYVNNFIKENSVFGEFDIIKFPSYRHKLSDKLERATVKGIHSNGNFLCEKEDGSKFQLSNYSLDDWCLPKDLEESEYDEEVVADLYKKERSYSKRITEERKKLPKSCKETLKEIKQEYKHLWS